MSGVLSINFPASKLWIDVEVADTRAEREQGLSGRASLDRGMIFIFPNLGDHVFWMHNVRFPVDAIFADDRSIIVGILESLPPMDDRLRRIGKSSMYVLEVNAGFVRAHNIRIGQHMAVVAV